MNVTKQQERVYESLRRTVPGIEFDVDATSQWGNGTIWLRFFFIDPRPSRNTFVDDGFTGSICIGPRGGFKCGSVWGHGLFSSTEEFSPKKKYHFWYHLLNKVEYAHPFYQ